MRNEQKVFLGFGLAAGVLGAAGAYYWLRHRKPADKSKLILDWPGLSSMPKKIKTVEVSLHALDEENAFSIVTINFADKKVMEDALCKMLAEESASEELKEISPGLYQAMDTDSEDYFTVSLNKKQICVGLKMDLRFEKDDFLSIFEKMSEVMSVPTYAPALSATKLYLRELWDTQLALAQGNVAEAPKRSGLK